MKLQTAIAWAVTAAMPSLFAACGPEGPVDSQAPGRWYTGEQIEQGRELYQMHCASCHGDAPQGLAADWRQTDANGNYPPPPLNGSAHAWHHSLEVLERTIAEGGKRVGGVMPGFANILQRHEIRATVAYFQSFWSVEVYAQWQEIDRR